MTVRTPVESADVVAPVAVRFVALKLIAKRFVLVLFVEVERVDESAITVVDPVKVFPPVNVLEPLNVPLSA